MSDEYKNMGRGELLARLQDWMRLATDRGNRVAELEAERDLLRDERDLFRDHAIPEAAQIMNGLSLERARLQAIVDDMPALAERTVRMLRQNFDGDLAADPDTIRDAIATALDALDESGEAE